MLSMILLTMVTATVLPVITTIYQERLTIRQQERVADYLEKLVQNYLTGQAKVPFDEFPVHLKERLLVGQLYEVCVNWTGVNQREYERCLYAKK